MRAVSPIKLVVLCTLLLITAFLVNSHSGKNEDKPAKEPLQQTFTKIGEGHFANNYPMDISIVEALKLDDYLFKSYDRDKGPVNLYIGYYRTAKKVGAAHDPLVCFQGQGWQIKNRERGEYTLTSEPSLTIVYSYMVAERQGESEMIVYWFQTNGTTSANTQSQKFVMVMDKLSGRSEDNAFVRISATIGDESPEAVRKRLFEFIEDFYPGFYRYVTGNN